MKNSDKEERPDPGGVGNVHVISLDSTPERLARFRKINDSVIRSQKFTAIDGAKVVRAELSRAKILDENVPFSRGAAGNLLSHLSLWQKAIDENRVFTVCEDDSVFNRNFLKTSQALYDFCKDYFDIIYWGWNFDAALRYELLPGGMDCVLFCDQDALRGAIDVFRGVDIYPALYKAQELYGFLCYTISPRGAKKLMEKMLPITAPTVFSKANNRLLPNVAVDIALNGLHAEFTSLVCVPPLVVTANDLSVSTVSKGAPGFSSRTFMIES